MMWQFTKTIIILKCVMEEVTNCFHGTHLGHPTTICNIKYVLMPD